MFAESVEQADQGEMRLDLSGITDEQFWERAEQRIYDALEAYAEQSRGRQPDSSADSSPTTLRKVSRSSISARNSMMWQ